MGRSILITGTSSGIGLAAVERFVADGWEVAGTVRKDADARRLADRFPTMGILQLDLRDEAAIDRVVGGFLDARGGVDAVVNNAGFGRMGPVEEVTLAQWREQMETNFFAVVRISQLALPFMRARGAGRLVQVSSGAGKATMPMFGPYCASKHALESFSEAMRYEVAPFGVGVSVVAPGPVTSRFDANRQVAPDEDVEASPYRDAILAMRRRTHDAHQKESSADDVVDAIVEAVTARRPRFRYPVGPMGWAAEVAKFVPQGVLDRSMGATGK